MFSYALTHAGAYKKLLVTRWPTPEEAKAYVESKNVAGEVVTIEADLAGHSGPALVSLYNTLKAEAAPPVNKFATKGDAIRRCFALIEQRPYSSQLPVEEPVDPQADIQTESTQEAGDDTMAKKATTKKTKAAKTPKAPRTKKEAKPKVGADDFGLRKGSKSSQAAAMFARASGATMAKVKEALGDSFYGMLGKLEDAGHKVKKDGKTIFLVAK